MKQFAIIQPKVVMLLGRVAAEGVLEKKVAVAKEHGQVIDPSTPFDSAQGKSSGLTEIKFFLTLHPAAALRFPNKYKPLLQEDFKKLKKIISS